MCVCVSVMLLEETVKLTHVWCGVVCAFSFFFFSRQIRRVTVLFVNLGLNEQTLLAAAVYDEAMKEMHQVRMGHNTIACVYWTRVRFTISTGYLRTAMGVLPLGLKQFRSTAVV